MTAKNKSYKEKDASAHNKAKSIFQRIKDRFKKKNESTHSPQTLLQIAKQMREVDESVNEIKVWDLNEKMKPLLQRAHKETEGYYFKEVEASPIVNRFGSYRGGYVPAKTDPLMVDQPVDQAIETTKLQFKMSLPSAPKGMTKSRNESYAAPLSLHLGYMTKHIDDTLRYAYVQPVLKDTLKILKLSLIHI